MAAEIDAPKSYADDLRKGRQLATQLRAIQNHPVNRMITARLNQPEVVNDPVLGAILEMDARELRRTVSRNMGRAIAIPANEPTQWRGTGQPPKTKVEKIAAIQAWDNMPDYDRPLLSDWLETNFGNTPNGDLAVAESTFHEWRKLKKP